jgi:hypothetical protein
MNSYRQPARYKFALGVATLDVILILITLIKQLPRLQPAFLAPFPQVLMDSWLWFTVAEICFYCAFLVALYCLVSLWIPEARFILWIGAGLVVGAGLLYLVAALVYYRAEGMGVPFQQGIFMFLLSLSVPVLVVRLIHRYSHINKKLNPVAPSIT